MSSVVLELQKDALDKAISITDLLRKALIVARKLKVSDFEQWVLKELNGYGDDGEVPEYRIVPGQVKAWNPYHGWKSVIFKSAERESILSKRACGQTIAEIESLIKDKSEVEGFHMPFPPEILRMLRKSIKTNTEITLFTQAFSLIKILDSVRTIVLNWSLKLEENGILGEDMSFSEHEKREVAKQSYNVTNFFGDVYGSQIQQGTENSILEIGEVSINKDGIEKFVKVLKSQLGEINFSGDDKEEINAEVTTIESQVKSPKPKISIIRESLGTVRRILEGASGSVVGELLKQIGELF